MVSFESKQPPGEVSKIPVPEEGGVNFIAAQKYNIKEAA